MNGKGKVGWFLDRLRIGPVLRRLVYRLGGARIKHVEVGALSADFYCSSPILADEVQSMSHEWKYLTGFLNHLSEGDCVWDIGANIGQWSLFCSEAVGVKGCVVAFEPMSNARKLLEQNTTLNGAENVLVQPVALGDKNEVVDMYPACGGICVTSNLFQRPGPYGTVNRPVKVQMQRARDFAAANTDLLPTAVKLDVEGAEQSVLEGFSDAIWEKIRMIGVEVHPPHLPVHGGSVDGVRALLEGHGFVIEREFQRDTQYHWICVRNNNQ